MIVNVPIEFQQPQRKLYPPDNDPAFEAWFIKNYDSNRNKSDRAFLAIDWTAFYSNHKHGQDRRAMRALQLFLDHSLDTGRKYFTIIQWDDNILNNVSHLDLKVFGMGCKGDYQLPLVCQPHPYEFKENGRPIFASFIGAVTHPIRQKMIDELKDKEGYFISTEQTSLHSYCKIMSMSKFALCPRGYGKTSFRIQEALQYGAIPVYIVPDVNDLLFTDQVMISGLNNLDEELRSFEANAVHELKTTYEKYFTYEAVANMIYENI